MTPMYKGQKHKNIAQRKRVETELGKMARDKGLCLNKPDESLSAALMEAYDRGVRRGRDDEKRCIYQKLRAQHDE